MKQFTVQMTNPRTGERETFRTQAEDFLTVQDATEAFREAGYYNVLIEEDKP